MRSRRRTVSVLATLLVAGAVLTAVVVQVGSDPSFGPAAESGPVGRTVDPPATVAGYHQITGEAAESLSARLPGTTPERVWFYSATPDDTRPGLIFSASTAQWSPRLAEEIRTHSLSWGLVNFFAGAKIDDPEDVDAGPLGGAMQCGSQPGKSAVVCRWGDASTVGSVAVFGTTDIRRAGAIAVQFRNAAEH
ncbi:hypothetical protein ABZW30_41585 [Kitasatospora sp. NPDC004669]|uniref:hypothetical protein n=1 Tax=Kitasatospora sp. NPDC004669 TaxID=3154555 RepID=UPI0033A107EC